MRIISVKIKILIIVLGFFSLIAATFFTYSAAVTANYRQLRIGEISKTVAFASERVSKIIAEMERNVVDLALAGRQFYLTGGTLAELDISISVENFSPSTAAVGGGIWFEPYAVDAHTRRVCYYALFDPPADAVQHDTGFVTEEYDYHAETWYTTIAAELDGKHRIVWTSPYFDEAVTNSLMTIVGAGIYDKNGRFVGMSTVDWQIQSMIDRLSNIKLTKNSFILLASPKDDYIISDTEKDGPMLTGASLRNLPWYSELRFTSDDSTDTGRFTVDGVEYISFSRLLDNSWQFSVQIPAREIFAEIETQNNQFTVIIAVSFLTLLVLAAYLLSRLIGRPLHKLTSGVAELGGGNLDKQIEINSKDEFGTLAAAFNKMTVDLKASIEQSAREHIEKERMGAELDVATKIQAAMLPCVFPPFPGRTEFDIYASMQPAREVGGDFYDFFLIDENTLAVVIADVCGKGIPAALFMVIAKTLIKNSALYGKSPGDVFKDVNNILCENNKANMFVTVFMGYLNIKSGRFTFVNAGHNPPLLRSRGRPLAKVPDGKFNWMQVKPGFVLAVMEDILYKQDEITLRPGDELFLYTDGATEAANREKELFENQRLLDTVNNNLDLPLKEFTVSLKREIDKFADGAEQADDITMLALRYIGGGNKAS